MAQKRDKLLALDSYMAIFQKLGMSTTDTQKLMEEGFVGYALAGSGPWVGNIRLLSAIYFFNRSGNVRSFEELKAEEGISGMTYRGREIKDFTADDFKKHIKELRITVGKRMRLK